MRMFSTPLGPTAVLSRQESLVALALKTGQYTSLGMLKSTSDWQVRVSVELGSSRSNRDGKSCESERRGFPSGGRSRRRFASPADVSTQDRGLHIRRESVCRAAFKGHFLSPPVPTLIVSVFSAVGDAGGELRLRSPPRPSPLARLRALTLLGPQAFLSFATVIVLLLSANYAVKSYKTWRRQHLYEKYYHELSADKTE
jgi:hypothetical protein